MTGIGKMDLSHIGTNMQHVGTFDATLLAKWIKTLNVAEVDVAIVKHICGTHALALRDSLDQDDNWICVCPLEIINE